MTECGTELQLSTPNGAFRRPISDKQRRRLYPVNIAKTHWCYTIEDVCGLYNVHSNTVYNWFAEGLIPIDDRKPRVMRGSELNRFHTDRREKARRKLKPGELFCTSCKRPRYPMPGTICLGPSGFGSACVQAGCSICSSALFRHIGTKEMAFWLKRVTHNPTPDSGDE